MQKVGNSVQNSETHRLVQNVILKMEKINVFIKPVMVKHP